MVAVMMMMMMVMVRIATAMETSEQSPKQGGVIVNGRHGGYLLRRRTLAFAGIFLLLPIRIRATQSIGA